ncbi:ASIC5 [Bugula neritina]|nr:ASIC5 [Bugula neritina]
MINLVAQQSPGLARNTESSCAPPFPESESEHSVNSREAIHPSPNMAGNVDEESNAEKIELYEAYWIQNTTAHGCSRLANTAKFQRFVWVLALLTCFVYVSIEVYNSFDFYYQYLTTTEINKINKPEIPFPAVTICNFNR